jgi:hypothetical protein
LAQNDLNLNLNFGVISNEQVTLRPDIRTVEINNQQLNIKSTTNYNFTPSRRPRPRLHAEQGPPSQINNAGSRLPSTGIPFLAAPSAGARVPPLLLPLFVQLLR